MPTASLWPIVATRTSNRIETFVTLDEVPRHVLPGVFSVSFGSLPALRLAADERTRGRIGAVVPYSGTVVLGTLGSAPTPLHLFVAGLTGCLMTQMRNFAGRMGVTLNDLTVDVRALRAALPAHIAIVEDAAHAFPSPIAGLGGRFAGTVGRAGAFSFYATKNLTSGEGGALVTDDEALASFARSFRLHGMSRDAWDRYRPGR